MLTIANFGIVKSVCYGENCQFDVTYMDIHEKAFKYYVVKALDQ